MHLFSSRILAFSFLFCSVLFDFAIKSWQSHRMSLEEFHPLQFRTNVSWKRASSLYVQQNWAGTVRSPVFFFQNFYYWFNLAIYYWRLLYSPSSWLTLGKLYGFMYLTTRPRFFDFIVRYLFIKSISLLHLLILPKLPTIISDSVCLHSLFFLLIHLRVNQACLHSQRTRSLIHCYFCSVNFERNHNATYFALNFTICFFLQFGGLICS